MGSLEDNHLLRMKFIKSLSILGLVVIIGFVAQPVHAQPLQFVPTVQTAPATTTLSYMTPGTATTTLTYDSFLNGQIKGINQGVLLTQFTASSTGTIFNINIEDSQDGIDWYKDNTNAIAATTSLPYALNTVNSYTFPFASTSADGAPVAANNKTSFKAVTIDFPTRFVRIFYTLVLGGNNGAVWGQFISERQSN